jgi:hypothetical protein
MRMGVIFLGGKQDMVRKTEKDAEGLIRNRNFEPEKYGMVQCFGCKGHGYVTVPKRRCCPHCGGFGWIRGEGLSEREAKSGL